MGTSVYATYKYNICNKPLQHVEQPRETWVAYILKQPHETSIAFHWILYFKACEAYTFVKPMHDVYVWTLQHLNYTYDT
jgi:hypothetical protein